MMAGQLPVNSGSFPTTPVVTPGLLLRPREKAGEQKRQSRCWIQRLLVLPFPPSRLYTDPSKFATGQNSLFYRRSEARVPSGLCSYLPFVNNQPEFAAGRDARGPVGADKPRLHPVLWWHFPLLHTERGLPLVSASATLCVGCLWPLTSSLSPSPALPTPFRIPSWLYPLLQSISVLQWIAWHSLKIWAPPSSLVLAVFTFLS